MTLLRQGLLGLALATVACAALMMAGRPSTSVPTYDDAISFLAATASLDDWEATTDVPVSVRPASEWRGFAQHDGAPDLVGVYRGMGRHDLHPPAYPMVLAVWSWVTGVSLAASLLLNAALLGGTGAVVHVLARRVGLGPGRALAAGAVAAIGPAAVATGLETRSYALAGLLTAVTWLLALRHPRPDLTREIALAVSGATLLLTHYSGIWALLGAGVLRLVSERPGRFIDGLRSFVPILIAPLVALALFPAVLDQVSRQAQTQRVGVADVDFVERGREVVVAMASFLVQGRPALILIATAALVTLALLLLVRHDSPVMQAVGWATLVTLAAIVGVYVAGLVPAFAMRSKYLVFAMPGVAIALAGLIPSRRSPVEIAVGLTVLLLALATSWTALAQVLPREPTTVDASTVIVDTTSRGIVLPVVWALPPETNVLVGSQAALASALSAQVSPDECVLYVSSLRREGSEEGRHALLEQLEAPKQLPSQFAGAGTAWESGC